MDFVQDDQQMKVNRHYCSICDKEFSFKTMGHLYKEQPELLHSPEGIQVSVTQEQQQQQQQHPKQSQILSTTTTTLPTTTTTTVNRPSHMISSVIHRPPPVQQVMRASIVQRQPVIQPSKSTTLLQNSQIIRQPIIQTIKREQLEYVDCTDPNCTSCQYHQPSPQIVSVNHQTTNNQQTFNL